MKNTQCIVRPLVSSETCSLWRCSNCGIVYLNLSGVSMRLDWDTLTQLTTNLNIAISQPQVGYTTFQAENQQKTTLN